MKAEVRRIRWRRILKATLSAGVVAVVFLYVLPRIVDYGEVQEVVGAMTWLELATLALLASWNQVTYVILEVAARPGLSYKQAFTITLTSTAVANTLPGGGALGAGTQTAIYASYGFSRPDTLISMMVTGVWNTWVKLAMPIVALALLAVSGQAGSGFVVAAVAGVGVLLFGLALFWSALSSERGALVVGRRAEVLVGALMNAVRRPRPSGWAEKLADFRRRAVQLLRHRWGRVTAASVISHVTLYVVLLVALRHVGISNSEVSWEEALAAFAFVRLLSIIPITPGGLGVVELGTTAALVAAGGDEAQVVAAVLVFRLLTFVLPIPLGALAYLAWRRELKGRTPSPVEGVS